MSNCKANKGYSFVELLVVSVIICIGVSGFVLMQSRYLQQGEQLQLSSQRVAMIRETLARMQYLSSQLDDARQPNFEALHSNSGPQMQSGEVPEAELIDGMAKGSLTRQWQVKGYRYDDSASQGGPPRVWDTPDERMPPSLKSVEIEVSSPNANRPASATMLSAIVAPIRIVPGQRLMGLSEQASFTPQIDQVIVDNAAALWSSTPDGSEVLALTSGMQLINNQPVRRDSKLLHKPGAESATVSQLTEITTINCTCRLAGQAIANQPYMLVLENESLARQALRALAKQTGVAEPDQPSLCTACCVDHHDTLSMKQQHSYFRLEQGLPHKHYRRLADGQLVAATQVGQRYDEVCRFQRINGDFKLVPDVQLMAVSVATHDSEAQDLDSKDLTTLLNSDALARFGVAELPSIENSLNLFVGASQMWVRGIYMEPMNEPLLRWLTRMSENEPHSWQLKQVYWLMDLTAQTFWQTSNDSVAQPIQQPVTQDGSAVPVIYTLPMRSVVLGHRLGTASLMTLLTRGQSALLSLPPISPHIHSTQINLLTRVRATSSEPTANGSVGGQIHCVVRQVQRDEPCNQSEPMKPHYLDLSAIKISANPQGGQCRVVQSPSAISALYTCQGFAQDWQGELIVSLDQAPANWSIGVLGPDSRPLVTPTIPLHRGVGDLPFNHFRIQLRVHLQQ